MMRRRMSEMVQKEVCLDFHMLVYVDVPEGMDEESVSEIAFKKYKDMSPKEVNDSLTWDGYVVDYSLMTEVE